MQCKSQFVEWMSSGDSLQVDLHISLNLICFGGGCHHMLKVMFSY